MPLVLPYQNAENAFRVLEILLQLMMEQESFTSPTLVQMMKVAKEAVPEIPPMLVLDAWNPVPLVDLQGNLLRT
jgi:isoleucyl-tRNA synthetase